MKSLRNDIPATVEVPNLLSARDIARHADVDTSTVYRAVREGDFPQPLTGFVGRNTRWLASEYLDYIERQKQKRGMKRHA